MKFFIYTLSIFLFFQCTKKSEHHKPIKDEMHPKVVQSDKDTIYIEYEKIKNLSYDIVIDSLSKIPLPNKKMPYAQETFILGDDNGAISEFRIGLLDIHTIEKIKNNDILIKEVHWEISPTHNFTIWYERKDREWKPINNMIWDKSSEF